MFKWWDLLGSVVYTCSFFSNPTLHRHLAPLRTDFTFQFFSYFSAVVISHLLSFSDRAYQASISVAKPAVFFTYYVLHYSTSVQFLLFHFYSKHFIFYARELT